MGVFANISVLMLNARLARMTLLATFATVLVQPKGKIPKCVSLQVTNSLLLLAEAAVSGFELRRFSRATV